MISRDIQIIDVHPEHWTRLLRGRGGEGGGPGWLWVIHEGGRVVHAAFRGAAVVELIGGDFGDLASLRRRYGAGRVVCMERDLLRRVFARSEAALSYEMDFAEQVYTIFREFRCERGTGLRIDPPTPPGPLPPFEWIQFVFDRVWPDGSSVVFYVVDEGSNSIFTSLILRKRRGDVDLLTTDLHLGADGLKPGDWRRDVDRLLDVVSARVARPWLGVFGTLDAWKEGRVFGTAFFKTRPAGLAAPLRLIQTLHGLSRRLNRARTRFAPAWP